MPKSVKSTTCTSSYHTYQIQRLFTLPSRSEVVYCATDGRPSVTGSVWKWQKAFPACALCNKLLAQINHNWYFRVHVTLLPLFFVHWKAVGRLVNTDICFYNTLKLFNNIHTHTHIYTSPVGLLWTNGHLATYTTYNEDKRLTLRIQRDSNPRSQ